MESGETGILPSPADKPTERDTTASPREKPAVLSPRSDSPSVYSSWGSTSGGRVPTADSRTRLLTRDKKVEAIIKARKVTHNLGEPANKDTIAAPPGTTPVTGSGGKARPTLRSGDASSSPTKAPVPPNAFPVKRGTLLSRVFDKFSSTPPTTASIPSTLSPRAPEDGQTRTTSVGESQPEDTDERSEEEPRNRWQSPTEEELNAVISCQRMRRRLLQQRALAEETLLNAFPENELTIRRRRQKVIDEIITTEVTYIANLQYCRDQLLIPLRRMTTEEKWRKLCPSITTHDISVMFSNMERLIPLNQSLLEALLDHMTRPDLPLLQARVGHIFSEYAPQFKFYSIYITNYHFSIDTLKKCEKNKYFCQAVRELGLDIGGGSVQIKSFLIMPIQRIPRYELFLRDLIKYTPADHTDLPQLKQALQAITALDKELDVNKVKIDNFEKLLEISRNISKAPFNIVEPTRRLIKEGVLRRLWGQDGSMATFIDKRARQKNKPMRVEEYTFFLFNDLLLCVQPKGSTCVADKGAPPKNSYRYVNSFSWDSRIDVGHSFEVADIPESETIAYGFRLIYKRGSDGEVLNELGLAASSADEKKEWMTEIDAQIKSTQSSRRQGLGSKQGDGSKEKGAKDSALAPICFGFMRKRGGVRKSWKRRYFQLKGSTIFYYAEAQDSEALGRIWLPDYRLEVAPRSIVGNKEFCFCLFHSEGGRNYYFEADSLEELNKWTDNIQTCKVPISDELRGYLAEAASSYKSVLTT